MWHSFTVKWQTPNYMSTSRTKKTVIRKKQHLLENANDMPEMQMNSLVPNDAALLELFTDSVKDIYWAKSHW